MKTNHIFALLAILAGTSAAFTSHSVKNNLYPTWKFEKARVEGERVRYISVHHLANLLYQKQPLTLLDIRNWKAYEDYHIPTALHHNVDQKTGAQKSQGWWSCMGRRRTRTCTGWLMVCQAGFMC